MVVANQDLAKESIVLGGADLGEGRLPTREHHVAVVRGEVLSEVGQKVDLRDRIDQGRHTL